MQLESSPMRPGDDGIGDPYVKTDTKAILAAPCQKAAPCEKKVQFVASYSAIVEAYYSSVAELERRMICQSKKLFAMQLKSTERVRVMCEDARKRLDDHVSIHGC
jgi:hypothetical protein